MGNCSSAIFTGVMRKVIRLAGIPIGIDLNSSAYEPIFGRFSTQDAPEMVLSVSPQEIIAAQKIYEPGSSVPYIEYMELCPKISDALLPYGRVFFHGTAFLWRGRAWIFTANSGTGKTTQYLLWKELCGEEIQIINGDKPVLAFDTGNITVCPSPWNGKEGMGQPISAPLGGIILLRQSNGNHIRRVRAAEAVAPVFMQFLFTRKTVADVRAACALEDRLLRRTPVWLLENRGDTASAALCRDTLMEELT